MLERNMLSMRKFLTNKNEENNKLKDSINDLIALNLKINKKWEILLENLKQKKIKRKQFLMPLKEKPGK